MQQLTQNLKNGSLTSRNVSAPQPTGGTVLVRNHFSLISTGTEGKRVHDAKLGYVAKARARKKEVSQVLESVKSNGLAATYQLVNNKLAAPASLGYCCAGEVVSIGAEVRHLQVGDLVACGGGEAAHAEVVSVPVNLCAKVPPDVPLEQAAFTTLGAIAMQGVRQADLRLGESCAVIGLGLVGQLTAQILRASGVRTIGIDIDAAMVELAGSLGTDFVLCRGTEHLERSVAEFTAGYGVDAVIITAGTSSLDPIDLAGRLCRHKGRVVVVGSVPTGFSREHYYKKELELRMSCSYGPGRYDEQYEQKGIDYPIGYVRWTENRNMQAFLQLLADNRLNLEPLITQRFPFERAPEAYEMIVNKSEPFVGVLLKYDIEKPLSRGILPTNGHARKVALTSGKPAIGFIGAGSFAQNYLLPNIGDQGELVGVATAHGHTARHIADKYGFSYSSCDANQILEDPTINTVFVATRHNLHADLVLRALEQSKHVFVEKPLCLSEAELGAIQANYDQANVHLMVGFNRRFASFIEQLRSWLPPDLPRAINYRINAGWVPANHWIHDPEVGGGRIIGEFCHFVDLARFLAGSEIISVSACDMSSASNLQDTVIVNLTFSNGSVASISYFSNGSKKLPKEYLEVFCGGQVGIIDDFRALHLHSTKSTKSRARQDKGHSQEVRAFLDSLKNGGESPIPFPEIYQSTLATFKILESLRTGQTIRF